MAEIKSATVRGASTVPSTRGAQGLRTNPQTPIAPRPQLQEPVAQPHLPKRSEANQSLIGAFIEPSSKTVAWLSDSRMVATLQAASAVLAPEGSAQDPTDRYAASVIETHLVARSQLSKQTNALLKT